MDLEEYKQREQIDKQIDAKLEQYDKRLWERIDAYIAKEINPKLQTLFLGYSLGKWLAGVVAALAIGTIWQIVTTVISNTGGS